MQFLMYALWKCITNVAGLYLLILMGAATVGVVIASLLRPKVSWLKAATCAGVFAAISMPFFWWYLLNLVDLKTGLSEPASFAFVKDLRSNSVTCASATESALVVQIQFCGVAETAIQDRMLADLQKTNTYSGRKPVAVTFRPTSQKTEVANPDGSKSVWFEGGGVLREELLPIRSNRVFESDARQEQPRAPQHGR